MEQELWIVAGPNGAGKTTWVRGALEERPELTYLVADRWHLYFNAGETFYEVAMGTAREGMMILAPDRFKTYQLNKGQP